MNRKTIHGGVEDVIEPGAHKARPYRSPVGARLVRACLGNWCRLAMIVALGSGVIAGSSMWAAAADRLELPSGEVLVGTMVNTEGETYVFRSIAFGELRVTKEGTKFIPAASTDANPAAQAPTWSSATPPPAPPAAAAPAPTPVAKPATTPAVASAPEKKATWQRRFEGGFSFQERGKNLSTRSTYVRAEATRKAGDNTANVFVRYIYGKQNDVANASKFETGLGLRHNFAERAFLRNDFTYGFDRLKELSNQFEENAGVSLVVWKSARVRYATGPGVAVQYAEPALGERGFKVLGDVSEELSWKISKTVSLTHKGSYLFKPEDWNNYRLRANTALTGNLSPSVDVNLRYEYEFEAIRPVVDGRSDHRVFTTLGYRF